MKPERSQKRCFLEIGNLDTLRSLIARTLHLFILYILNFLLMHIQFGSFIVIGGYSKKCQRTPGRTTAVLPTFQPFVGAINARLSAAKISFKFLHAASEFCRPPAKNCNLLSENRIRRLAWLRRRGTG